VPQPTRSTRTAAAVATGLVGCVLLAGCGAGRHSSPAHRVATAAVGSGPVTSAPAVEVQEAPAAAPGPVSLAALRGPRLRPDVLVTATKPLTATEVKDVSKLAPGAVAFASGAVHVRGQVVRVASVDPATFRRFAAAGTAESTPVWQAVANGGLIASHALAKRLHLPLGTDVDVVGPRVLPLRLGALATTGIPGTDLVVDTATGRRLGLTDPTTLLLTAGSKDPASLASKVRALTGATAEVDLLTAPAANPVAFLTGSKAAHAFGAFSYKYFADGTIEPDAAWVRASIVSATVPIFGRVTCHRLMVPQLRGALQEVVDAGLASALHTYDGCYVPRFIEHNPAHAISLHTWGIAIDLDASTNYRGIRGTMDPRVVTIFKRWGFRWGGDWKYTDPMHFEIGALLSR
jgi:hypothetical protein